MFCVVDDVKLKTDRYELNDFAFCKDLNYDIAYAWMVKKRLS